MGGACCHGNILIVNWFLTSLLQALVKERLDHAEVSSSFSSLQGVVSAVFSERCQLRKGLAELDAQERHLNWKIRSKENSIRRLESLGAGPEKKDQVGKNSRQTSHHCYPCLGLISV